MFSVSSIRCVRVCLVLVVLDVCVFSASSIRRVCVFSASSIRRVCV